MKRYKALTQYPKVYYAYNFGVKSGSVSWDVDQVATPQISMLTVTWLMSSRLGGLLEPQIRCQLPFFVACDFLISGIVISCMYISTFLAPTLHVVFTQPHAFMWFVAYTLKLRSRILLISGPTLAYL